MSQFKPLDREGFVEKWQGLFFPRLPDHLAPNNMAELAVKKREMLSDLDALLEHELLAGVEWGIKHASQRDDWPIAWDRGFPGMKAQALIDRAAAIRAGKEGGG